MQDLWNLLLVATLPSIAGGLSSFWYGLRRGHYRNNKFKRKAVLECIGAATVGSGIAIAFVPLPQMMALTFFAAGVCWSGLIQLVRKKVDAVFKAIFGDTV